MIEITTPLDFVRDKQTFRPQVAKRARAEAEAELGRARVQGEMRMREASNQALAKLEHLPGAKDPTPVWSAFVVRFNEDASGTYFSIEWVET